MRTELDDISAMHKDAALCGRSEYAFVERKLHSFRMHCAALALRARYLDVVFKGLFVLLSMTWVVELSLADMLDTEALSSWEVCAMCHGVDGVSVVPRFPNLAGQKPEYIVRQVKWFAKGYRINDGGQMQSTAANISSESLQQAALYFSKHNRHAAADRGDLSESERKIFTRGQHLYSKGAEGMSACSACHDNAISEAPWLYGQHKSYLIKQIKEFALQRRYSQKAPRQLIYFHLEFERLDEESIQTIAFFLAKSTLEESLAGEIELTVGEK